MKLLFFLSLLFTTSFAFAQDVAPCDDSQSSYKHCADQTVLLRKAEILAIQKRKPLLIILGYQLCPYCQALEIEINHYAIAPLLEQQFVVQTLAVADLQPKGLASGKIVSQKLTEMSNSEKGGGVPALYIVDPLRNRAVRIDSGPLEYSQSAYHSMTKLFRAINKGLESLNCEGALNTKGLPKRGEIQ